MIFGQLTDDLTASHLDFDFSRNKSLRTFEVTAQSIKYGTKSGATWTSLETAVSTIAPSTSLEVVVVYLEPDFRGASHRRAPGRYKGATLAEREEEALWHCELFRLFRRLHAVQKFHLTLCVDVWDGAGEYAKGLLKQAMAVERSGKGFGYLSSEPLMIYRPRGPVR